MKKNLLFMATALLALASCSEENLLENPNIQNRSVLTATFEQETTSTRVNIDADNNALSWSDGDAIAVFGTTPVKYEYQTSTDGAFLIAEGNTAPETISSAAFPYSDNVSLNENTLTMTLPSKIDQTTDGELDMPMWGTVNENNNVSFKHLAGILKVNLSDVPKGYNTLTVTASNAICGEFTANISEDSPVLSGESTDEASKTVTVTFPGSASNSVYLPLPVGNYASIVVSISGEGKEEMVLKKWENKTVTRAGIYSTSANIQTEAELKQSIANGGDVTLNNDIELTSSIFVDKTVTLNLNGYNITTTGTSFYEQGVVSAAICVKVNGKLTITGDGTIDSQSTEDYAVEVRGGEVNIKGGKYVGCVTSAYALTGTINISGGEFSVCDEHAYEYAYVLNLLDANGKNGTAAINVTGGNFYNFNPSNNKTEGTSTNFVTEGYLSYKSSENQWTVVPNTTPIEVKSEDDLKNIATQGGIAVLVSDLTLDDYIEVLTDMTVRLNGKKIIHPATSSATYKDVFEVYSEGKLTIEGEGQIIAEDGYCVYAAGNSTVLLNGGSYYAPASAVDARKNAIVTITGGEYYADVEPAKNTPEDSELYGHKYTLNLRDKKENYVDELAAIIVIGGRFYKYNPAESYSENPVANFVAEGYSSVANGDYYEVSEGIKNELALRKALANGGDVTLNNGIELTSPIFVDKTVTLNLNGYNITTTGTSFYEQGVVSAAICVKENGELTITGNGTIDSQSTEDYAVEVRGGEVNIEGGKYVGCVTSVYALTGTINISGGEFSVCDEHAYEYAYVLNLLDANGKNGTAAIKVTGGKFYKFNPAENKSENPAKDYVQAGYSSVADGDYYVVSQGND